MANEEHLAILRQGVVFWNEWRDENPDIIPNLSGNISHYWYEKEADLRGIKVSRGVYVSKARKHRLLPKNLNGANLNNANLSRADLSEADLTRVSSIGTGMYVKPKMPTVLKFEPEL